VVTRVLRFGLGRSLCWLLDSSTHRSANQSEQAPKDYPSQMTGFRTDVRFRPRRRKPVCEACLAEAEAKESADNGELPPRIERERGRRPWIDTSRHFCCEDKCEYGGSLGRGNIVSKGHPSGGRWRQLRCVVCGKHPQETIGIVFPPGGDVPYGSSVPAEETMHWIALLCEWSCLQLDCRRC
jgi:hypothetical protein